jgi:hypothetical protein
VLDPVCGQSQPPEALPSCTRTACRRCDNSMEMPSRQRNLRKAAPRSAGQEARDLGRRPAVAAEIRTPRTGSGWRRATTIYARVYRRVGPPTHFAALGLSKSNASTVVLFRTCSASAGLAASITSNPVARRRFAVVERTTAFSSTIKMTGFSIATMSGVDVSGDRRTFCTSSNTSPVVR